MKDGLQLWLEAILGPSGHMLSSSKRAYRRAHPSHAVFFNAKVAVEGHGVIWRGDLDLSEASQEDALKGLAREAAGRRVLVYSEYAPEVLCPEDLSDTLWSAVFDDAIGSVRVSFNEDGYARDAAGRMVVRGESLDEISRRMREEVARDRASLQEENLTDILIPFPYREVAEAAASRRKKDEDPLIVFASFVSRRGAELGLKDAHLSAVLHADDYELLERADRRRVRRMNPWMSDDRIQESISWNFLNLGPRSFVKGGTPDCIPRGVVRLLKTVP
jgi:hypothetical protein